MIITFNKVKEQYGWLSNMSPYSVEYKAEHYKTTEALFQSLRFNDNKIIEEIREQKSPMRAKMVAYDYKDLMFINLQSNQDLDNMRLCLKLKIEQHPELLTELIKTGDALIIEDCTKRQHGSGLFWGAAVIYSELEGVLEGKWTGENCLGKLWMELRGTVKGKS